MFSKNLTSIMLELEYDIDFKGVCMGFSRMRQQAALTGKIHEFNSRLKKMLHGDKDLDQDTIIHLLKTFWNDHPDHSNESATLKDVNKEFLFNVFAFLDGVAFFQAPERPKQREVINEEINFTNLETIMAFTASKELEARGNMITAEGEKEIFTIQDLEEYLNLLAKKITSIQIFQLFPPEYNRVASLTLSANGHRVSLEFDTAQKVWILTDINKYPLGKKFNSFELANELITTDVLFNKRPTQVEPKDPTEIELRMDIAITGDHFAKLLATKPAMVDKKIYDLTDLGLLENMPNDKGIWPIEIACQYKNKIAIQTLISLGFLTTYQNDEQNIIQAAIASDQQAKKLIQQIIAIDNTLLMPIISKSNELESILSVLLNNDYDFAEILLIAGADINATFPDGQNLAHKTAFIENFTAFNWLIDRGIDLTQSDNDGNTPIHTAVRHLLKRMNRLYGDFDEEKREETLQQTIDNLLTNDVDFFSLNHDDESPFSLLLDAERFDIIVKIMIQNPSLQDMDKNLINILKSKQKELTESTIKFLKSLGPTECQTILTNITKGTNSLGIILSEPQATTGLTFFSPKLSQNKNIEEIMRAFSHDLPSTLKNETTPNTKA